MKKILVFAIMIMALVSCSSNNDVEEATSEYMANIELTGDIQVSSSSLTRASSDKSTYHGFVVYKEDSYGQWQYYAQGLFKNPTRFLLKVQSDAKYKIQCVCIEEIDDRLPEMPCEPFSLIPTSVEYTFTYGGTKTMDLKEYSSIRTTEGLKLMASAEYFYGEQIFQGSQNVSINMTRHTVGLHFVVNVPQGGSVRVYNRYSSVPLDITFTEYTGITKLLSFPYEDTIISLVADFTYSDGSTVTKGLQDYKLKNKTLLNITINIPEKSENTCNITTVRNYIFDTDNISF